ncbi:MAG: hypothetical protein HY819_19700 [Acidobacteria bacterium]|nr:hypothetical protein [Acidobacteriota bacterium]
MSPGMKFRRSCNSCNTTFFAEDRKAFLCPKCVKKKAAAPAVVSKPSFSKSNYSSYNSSSNPSSSFGSKPSSSFSSKPDTATSKVFKPAQKKFVKPGSKPKPRIARQPKTGILTDELKDKIITSYLTSKDLVDSIKKLHAKISHELWVKPKLVADTINHLRKQEKALSEVCSLSNEDKERVLKIYLKLVHEDIRPIEGRRNHIANELNLPPREVILAVREWSNNIMGQLSRQQLFLIEKEYWRIITQERYHTFADLPKVISKNLDFVSIEQSSRWLDQLHDNTKLVKVPLPEEEKQKQIIEAYKQYLAQAEPPPQALHTTFAKTFGVKALQVHKILCDYRCQLKPA